MKLKCKNLAEAAEAADVKCLLIVRAYEQDQEKWTEMFEKIRALAVDLEKVTSIVVTERCGFTRTTEYHEYMQILNEGGRELPTGFIRWKEWGYTIPIQPKFQNSRSKVPYPTPTSSYNPTLQYGANDPFMAMRNTDGTTHSVLSAIAINEKALDDASLYIRYDPSTHTHNN
jgi:hypothetical protein